MPNSVLWVCLVAVWLFVLVPMVIKGRPQILKSTDAVKKTRLLHRGGSRAQTAAGARRRSSARHPHDPNWKPSRKASSTTATAVLETDEGTADENTKVEIVEMDGVETEVEVVEVATTMQRVVDADVEKPTIEPDDADLEGGATAEEADDSDLEADADEEVESEVAETDSEDVDADADADADAEDDVDYDADADHDDTEVDDHDDSNLDDDAEYDDTEYDDTEYDEDAEYEATDELDEDEYDDYARGARPSDEAAEVEDEVVEEAAPVHRTARPERRASRSIYSSEKERELKYRERQRVTLSLFVLLILALISGFVFGTVGWVAAGLAAVALVGYLTYLRRAVKVEQQIRAQRLARAKRAALAEEERRRRAAAVPEFAAAPPPERLRRPGGVVVLEIDDEDPVFDHLPPFQRRRMEREDIEYRRVG
ncbi:divisome protein SepX/GlpR [Gordonia paraffinivorans]|uniref:divisome protein SepX/GlpR n=1 Tax=Gordonia paraffinivorans TaxID=175628 RepID=UPI00144587A8|nr:gephyrin-like molybdotransferase receptor GlpR [Gordonia paraffinivorans]